MQTIIGATQKETAIDQQQHSCETLICQRRQTILRLLSRAATASTRWRVRELYFNHVCVCVCVYIYIYNTVRYTLYHVVGASTLIFIHISIFNKPIWKFHIFNLIAIHLPKTRNNFYNRQPLFDHIL